MSRAEMGYPQEAFFATKRKPDIEKQSPAGKQEDTRGEGSPFGSKIKFAYDGILASRMLVHEDRLTEFAKASDLHSDVIILCGENKPGVSYVSISEVLAQKQTSSIFSLTRKQDEVMTVKTHPAVILIHDQVLAQKIKEENKGKLEEAQYVQAVNSLVSRGLFRIANIEKLHLLANSIEANVRLGANGIVSAGIGYVGGRLLIDGGYKVITGTFGSSQSLMVLGVSVLGTVELFGGIAILFRDLSFIILETVFPYLEAGAEMGSLWDLNPLKHVKDNIFSNTDILKKKLWRKEFVSFQ